MHLAYVAVFCITYLTLAHGLQDFDSTDLLSEPRGAVNCVYILNQNGECLYADGDQYAYDNDRRRVFTWVPGNLVSGGKWKIDDDGSILNLKYNEYLYMPSSMFDANIYGNSYRQLFTWRKNRETVSSSSYFDFVEENDTYFHIQNRETGLYLLTNPNSTYQRDRRNVHGYYRANSGTLWKFRNC
jgi:hypothetical protein